MSHTHLSPAPTPLTGDRLARSAPSRTASRRRRRLGCLAVNVAPPAHDRFGYLKRVYD